ncbi:hypothetical protein C1J01_17675 [Nonomuraea aridisoli]|uniref:Uncharacterized protein n=1 Tax=Nonomuraea aridisoli TaxID=2070368 RepID=A0A2W2E4U0_9ACTN|nr:hypothetical protein C1J01_17675 [Nonomuraea aridisoli]
MHHGREGPNPPGSWGMGRGMVDGVWLCDGRAERYRTRFVRTPGVAQVATVELGRDAPGDREVVG